MIVIDEEESKPVADSSLEQEENDIELDRTGDEIEGENLTKNPVIEHDDEEPSMARFDHSFSILDRS